MAIKDKALEQYLGRFVRKTKRAQGTKSNLGKEEGNRRQTYPYKPRYERNKQAALLLRRAGQGGIGRFQWYLV